MTEAPQDDPQTGGDADTEQEPAQDEAGPKLGVNDPDPEGTGRDEPLTSL